MDTSPWGLSTAHRAPPPALTAIPTLDEEMEGPQGDREPNSKVTKLVSS